MKKQFLYEMTQPEVEVALKGGMDTAVYENSLVRLSSITKLI